MSAIRGKIVKGIGGFYYVSDETGIKHECKAAGKFRKKKLTPFVGDNVVFQTNSGNTGFITEILPRKNVLARPPIANIDLVLIVLSATAPAPDLVLCDKLLIQAQQAEIEPIIVINKIDAGDSAEIENIIRQYEKCCDVISVSAATCEGLDTLKKSIEDRTLCLAGQSAVGKSSLLNRLLPHANREVGSLSDRIKRGKQTTRDAEMYFIPECRAYVADTPGFSMYELGGIDAASLAEFYPEISEYAADCRFVSCRHNSEPDCSVKEAVTEGRIAKERYERYLQILKKLEEERNKW